MFHIVVIPWLLVCTYLNVSTLSPTPFVIFLKPLLYHVKGKQNQRSKRFIEFVFEYAAIKSVSSYVNIPPFAHDVFGVASMSLSKMSESLGCVHFSCRQLGVAVERAVAKTRRALRLAWLQQSVLDNRAACSSPPQNSGSRGSVAVCSALLRSSSSAPPVRAMSLNATPLLRTLCSSGRTRVLCCCMRRMKTLQG